MWCRRALLLRDVITWSIWLLAACPCQSFGPSKVWWGCWGCGATRAVSQLFVTFCASKRWNTNPSDSISIKKARPRGFENICFRFSFIKSNTLNVINLLHIAGEFVSNEVKLVFFCFLGKLAVKCSAAEVFWKECCSVIITIISITLICQETKTV